LFQTTEERKGFMKTVEQFMKKLLSFVSVDQAADEVMITCFDKHLFVHYA